jgi:hypothetical protein
MAATRSKTRTTASSHDLAALGACGGSERCEWQR